MLARELLRAFHASDDPPCLTEILRIFGSVASSLGKSEPGRLGEALVERQTLERVVYFLQNSLDEKLLGRVTRASSCFRGSSIDVIVGRSGSRRTGRNRER